MVNTQELLIETKNIGKKLNYINGNNNEEYNVYIQNLQSLYENTLNVAHLINLIRAEKKMFSTYTKLAKESASLAFKRNLNEKTLYFYLETRIANKSADEAKKILDETFDKISNKELKKIKMLYEGGIANKKGSFLKSNRMFARFKQQYEGGLYWQSSLIIDNYETGDGESTFLENEVKLPSLNKNINYDLILSVSCERNYFDIYAENFLKTLSKSCFSKIAVYISVVNIEPFYVDEKTKEWLAGKSNLDVYYVHYEIKDEDLIIPASAVARLVSIKKILKSHKKPVIFCEIDSVIVGDLKNIVLLGEKNNCDQMLRVIGHVMPWQMYTCGFGVFYPTTSGIKSSTLLEKYCKGVFNNSRKLMWADQAILEATVRFSSLVDGHYKSFSPHMSEITKCIYTPTGSQSNKLKKMQEKISL